MQQQQLAAQLAHHGGNGRPAPLSPTPNTSDSDSDISLGAHSPPISSPGPIRFGTSSPNPITSFRFGPHSPGPMPAQFRFGNHTPPSFHRIDRQSPPPTQTYRLDRKLSPETESQTYSRLQDTSPINVDSNDYKGDKDSPTIRVDNSPPQTSLQHSPPMNLRISDNLRSGLIDNSRIQPETPLPLRLGSASQFTTPLRIHVNNPRIDTTSTQQTTQQTTLHLNPPTHGGIVRIAPQSPNNLPPLHRPFSPDKMT